MKRPAPLPSVLAGAGESRYPFPPPASRASESGCRFLYAWILLLTLAWTPAATVQASEDDDLSRIYRTREERREAGVEHELAAWLTAQGLLEWETVRERRSGAAGGRTDNESEIVIDLGFTAVVSEALKGEVDLEFESGSNDLFTDEAVVVVERDPWELSIGRQYLPFGVFYSQFATGPLLEFGETRVAGATLSHDVDDRLDLSVSVYRGRSRELETGSRSWNTALGLEAWVSEQLSMSAGYMGNLADADGRLLEDESNRFSSRVPGLYGHVLWTTAEFELSFEALGAVESFDELDADRNSPWAWSLEFVRFVDPRFDWALRVERSGELEDEPGLRLGAAVNFRYHPRAFLTVEYLHGRFEDGLAEGDDGSDLDRVNQLGIMLSIAF